GLRTIELDKEIKLAPHQRFSIVASVKNDKNDAKIKFSDEEFSNLDLSYVNRDNQWVSSQKLFGGVARIKVFTRNNYKNPDSKNLLNDITNASVSFDKPKYRYGMQTEAKPKVMFNGEILKENIDYTVDYSYFYDDSKKFFKDSAWSGYGQVVINGKNKYTGKNKKFFTILVGLYPKVNNRIFDPNTDFTIYVDEKNKQNTDFNYGPGWKVVNPGPLTTGKNSVSLVYEGDDADFYRYKNITVSVIKTNGLDPQEKDAIANQQKNQLLQEVQTHLAQVNQKNASISITYQPVKQQIDVLNSEFHTLVSDPNDLSKVSLDDLQELKNKIQSFFNKIDNQILKISQDNLAEIKNRVQDYIKKLESDAQHSVYVDIINQLQTVFNQNSTLDSDFLNNEKQTERLLNAWKQAQSDLEKLPTIQQESKKENEATLIALKEKLKNKIKKIDALKNNGSAHLSILQISEIDTFLKQNHNTNQEIKQAIRVAQELLQKADKNIYADKLNSIKDTLETLAITEDLAKNHPDINNQLTGLLAAITATIEPQTVDAYKTRYEQHKDDIAKIKELIKRKQENEQETKQRLVNEIQKLFNRVDERNTQINNTYQAIKQKLANLKQSYATFITQTNNLKDARLEELESFKSKTQTSFNQIDEEILTISYNHLQTAKQAVRKHIENLKQAENTQNYRDILTELSEALDKNESSTNYVENEEQAKSLHSLLIKKQAEQIKIDNITKKLRANLAQVISQANSLVTDLTEPSLGVIKKTLESAIQKAHLINTLGKNAKIAFHNEINQTHKDLELIVAEAEIKLKEVNNHKTMLKQAIATSKTIINSLLNELATTEDNLLLKEQTSKTLANLNQAYPDLNDKTTNDLITINKLYKNLLTEVKNKQSNSDLLKKEEPYKGDTTKIILVSILTIIFTVGLILIIYFVKKKKKKIN
ncbi:hypothetical protein, partial [Ureaplasma zalophigenitalium]